MLTTTKNITLNGRSEFEVEGQKKIAATMTAVFGEDGSFSKSETVIDLALYEANKEAAQNDMKEFSDLAYNMSSEVSKNKEKEVIL